MSLYEVKIYEPAVTAGLFPRPERYRYTNMEQWTEDHCNERIKSLRHAEGTWHFIDGKCAIYDSGAGGYTVAEIVKEIDESRAMEPDRFEVITK